jgi:hypothetical protein
MAPLSQPVLAAVPQRASLEVRDYPVSDVTRRISETAGVRAAIPDTFLQRCAFLMSWRRTRS